MPRGTWVLNPGSPISFAYRSITFSGWPFQAIRLLIGFITSRPVRKQVRSSPSTPNIQRFRALTYIRFGLLPVRSPLLGESLLFSPPEVTKMFQFTSFASTPYGFRCRCPDTTRDGFPHSEIPGSKLVWQLPEAYRSLPRLSSPLDAKASTVCP